jgi:hypothetical protein
VGEDLAQDNSGNGGWRDRIDRTVQGSARTRDSGRRRAPQGISGQWRTWEATNRSEPAGWGAWEPPEVPDSALWATYPPADAVLAVLGPARPLSLVSARLGTQEAAKDGFLRGDLAHKLQRRLALRWDRLRRTPVGRRVAFKLTGLHLPKWFGTSPDRHRNKDDLAARAMMPKIAHVLTTKPLVTQTGVIS